jgi:hypothetical protein
MSALCECVDPGICSSGAVNARRLAKDTLKRALQVILDGIAMRLALPTGEQRAIVCNNEF